MKIGLLTAGLGRAAHPRTLRTIAEHAERLGFGTLWAPEHVVLFIHGGPGNPLSPYSDKMFGAWTKDFTIVQWDQRGAGMTYGRSTPPPDSKLTVKQMADDGNELALRLVLASPHFLVRAEREPLDAARGKPLPVGAVYRITDLELQALDPDRINALRSLGYIQ